MKLSRFVATTLTALALVGCAALDPAPFKPYSPDEIVAMTKSGKSAADVVTTLKQSRAYYTLPASELARMSKEGSPDEVINFLQSSQLEATRLAERNQMRLEAPFWYGSFYGPRFCYRAHGGRGSWVTCI
jgi:hypothetical protein